MSDQTTGRRQTSPLDDDDLLGEILLRVPPQPSSLPRASLVCKRWRRLVSDQCFLRRLRAHHRKPPPLLGFFEHRVFLSKHSRWLDVNDFVFSPIPEPPDRISAQRFSLERWGGLATSRLLGCRHGRVLLFDKSEKVFLVCDPVTGGHVRLVIPLEFANLTIEGTVLCAAGEEDHVHGACHWSPFKVVLVALSGNYGRPMVSVYSSETGLWGNIIRHDGPGRFGDIDDSSTLIARALYWNTITIGSEDDDEYMAHDGVLEFDLGRQTLTVIKGLPMDRFGPRRIIKAMDGRMGLATLSYPTLRVWHWNVDGCNDVGTWVLVKIVDLQSIFGLQEHETLPVSRTLWRGFILGYDEDDGVIFIHVDSSLFMLQLDLMQFKRHYESTERGCLSICYPLRSFYHSGHYL